MCLFTSLTINIYTINPYLISMDKETDKLFILFCLDVKTGKKEKVYVNECVFQSAKEEKAMFERNVPSNIATFEIVDIPNTRIRDESYSANPFDSSLKKERYSTITIPKDPNDYRDLPWIFKVDAIEKEKEWVNDIMDMVSNELYKQCINNGTSEFKTIGSLCHRGFINVLFDKNQCSEFKKVQYWIDQICDSYDPIIISNLQFTSVSDGIYVGGFYTNHVKRLCEYCEIMFGVNKYEVAKCFAKINPESFLFDEPILYKRAYNIRKVAAIYAENDNYEEALKYYTLSVDLLNGQNWQCNYQIKMDNFIDYVKKNGTPILSSNF